ncbi:MAG TPA: LysM peptidoglycan-binding domain-containing protein [Opitutaceae bacterium]|jgi:LysM repeat protein|nr:LysM peptidoglycan-binding domain-containing protein [Opitutaceae bacterium]
MKIHKTLGIVLAVHVVVIAMLFAIQGCSSTTKSAPAAGTADNVSPVVQPASTIDPSPVTIANASPAGTDLNPATTDATPTLNLNSGSGYYSPTRPGTPAAAAIESSAPVANVTPVATYVVVKGDSLSKIAVKYHLTRSELAKANGLKADSAIKIGQKLMIPGKASSAGMYAAAAPATDNGPSGVTYKVKAGDSLRLIAKHNGTTVSVLRSLNRLKSDNVRVGQVLKLPAGSTPAVSAPVAESSPAPDTTTPESTTNASGRLTHTVKAGEKLSTIAKKYGVTVGAIATANNISDPSKIRAGQELVIPNGSTSSENATPAATPTETTPTPPTTGDLDSGLKPTATEPPVIKVDDSNNPDTTTPPPPANDQTGTSTTPSP